MNRYIVSLKKTAVRVKEHFPRWSRKAAAVASAAVLVSLPFSARAEVATDLPQSAKDMISTGVVYLVKIADGVGTIGVTAIGIVILLGVIGVVMMFSRRPAG